MIIELDETPTNIKRTESPGEISPVDIKDCMESGSKDVCINPFDIASVIQSRELRHPGYRGVKLLSNLDYNAYFQ